jgi:pyruvate/2-oxoglutarate dehydrogenase complex dihydrolipoamide acyltransferase (E2) component
VTKALRDFPMVNISVDGTKLIVKKDINIGMAAALPSGNLIVPVIKNADLLSLPGLTKAVNDLANRARANQLKPEEIQGGTFTLTNVGTFGNVMGTPIINQPQVAILATGAIRKKPAVVETPYGDLIAVRQMMFLSYLTTTAWWTASWEALSFERWAITSKRLIAICPYRNVSQISYLFGRSLFPSGFVASSIT